MSVKNPVPEVAFPYVCDYFREMLKALLTPRNQNGVSVDGAVSVAISERAQMLPSIAGRIARKLYERGFIEYVGSHANRGAVGWARLTARGYLFAVELEKQVELDRQKELTRLRRSSITSCSP